MGDQVARGVVLVAAMMLLVGGVSGVVAPGRWRAVFLALPVGFGRLGSTAQRRVLSVIGIGLGATGVVTAIWPSRSMFGVVAVVLATLVVGRSLRSTWIVPRFPPSVRLRQALSTIRTRRSRYAALALVRHTVDTEIDPSVQVCADLAWWAAHVTVGSIQDQRTRGFTVVVPGRYGELRAVVPGSGALTLALTIARGPVDGITVRVADRSPDRPSADPTVGSFGPSKSAAHLFPTTAVARPSTADEPDLVRDGRTTDPDWVRFLQRDLDYWGYWSGGYDGRFTEALDDAVRAFQDANGLDADGWVGAKTWSVLHRRAVVIDVDTT